ncbi:MAG: AI-2E family transporter [Oscillospiraceae bacterium]|nr:AI-2E family transporter [Oscillospiraceae bacterium]
MNISRTSCVRLVITVLAAFLCIRYWSVAESAVRIAFAAAYPLIVGGVIAYILNILMSFYERVLPVSGNAAAAKLRRPGCMLLAFVTLLLVVVLLFRMILPELINCLMLIIEKLPGALRTAYTWMDENFNVSAYLTDQNIINTLENLDVQETVKKVVNVLMSGVGGAMGSIISGVSGVVSAVATAFIALVFSVYLLLGKETLGGQVTRLVKTYLGEAALGRLLYVSRTVDTCFHSFIVGQCLEAVILGVLCILGMTIFRFPYAMMIGCLVGFTALIPIAGAYIGAAVGAFMIFTVNPLQALLFVVFLVVLQQLEGNLIYPKVVGASIGLPGIYVLAAITIGGGVMGIFGMLLGVPVTAALYRLVKDNMAAREAAVLPAPELQETE